MFKRTHPHAMPPEKESTPTAEKEESALLLEKADILALHEEDAILPVPRGEPRSLGRVSVRIDAEVPLRYAVLTGLASDLLGAGASVSRLHVALRDHSIFPIQHIRHWNDPQAAGNRTALQRHLEMLAQQSQQKTLSHVMFLFAGHGQLAATGHRLLYPNRTSPEPITPQNAQEEDWLPWEILLSWFSPIQTHHLLVFVDCCDAGALLTKETQRWLEQLASHTPGHKLLWTGSDQPQQTWEQEGECFFTEALAEGWEGYGGYNAQGLVDEDLLFSYVKERVRKRAEIAGVFQYPSRLRAKSEDAALSLTKKKPHDSLPFEIEESLPQRRCLLWLGKGFLRHQGMAFPPRERWPKEHRDAWLSAQDQALTPREELRFLASLGLPIIDAAYDSLLSREFSSLWPHAKQWVPQHGSFASFYSEPGRAPLIRIHGDLGQDSFAYDSQTLHTRLQLLMSNLIQQEKQWDTLILLGAEEEEGLFESFFGALATQFPRRIWSVLGASSSLDLLKSHQKQGLRLVLIQEQVLLQKIQQLLQRPHPSRSLKSYKSFLRRSTSQSRPKTRSNDNPFPGLVPFSEEDAHLFFGRTDISQQQGDLDALLRDIRRYRKVILYGDSGNGKTSLLHAGLFPRLRQEGYSVYWTDSESPLEVLAQRVEQEPHFLQPIEIPDVFERLGYLSQQTGRPVLICIDQIERAFLLHPQTAQEPFQQSLLCAIQRLEQRWPQARWTFLFVIRKDRYTLLNELDRLPKSLYSSSFQARELLPLNRSMAQLSIEAPLPSPYKVHPSLLKHLLDALGQFDPERGEYVYHPALIQLVCRPLFAQAQSRGDLTLNMEHYEQHKGLQGLLQELLYQETLSRMSPPHERAARDLLSLLVSTEGLRRLRRWSELEEILQHAHELSILKDAREHLTHQRIIRQTSQRGFLYLEVAHDLLLDVVRDFHDQDIELADVMLRQLREWKASQRKQLSPWLLKEVQQRGGYLDRLQKEQQEELKAFVEHSQRKQKAKKQIFAGLWFVGLLLLLAVSWETWRTLEARNTAQRWTQVSKIEQSQGERQKSLVALSLALSARPKQKALRRSLAMWLSEVPLVKHHWLAHKDGLETGSIQPDGRMVATGSRDHQIALWSIRSGKRVALLKGHRGWVNHLAWHPKGRYLASASHDHEVRIWDAQEKRCVAVLRGHLSPVVSLAWHPNGDRLVSGSWDQTIRLWSFVLPHHSTSKATSQPTSKATSPPTSVATSTRPARPTTQAVRSLSTTRPSGPLVRSLRVLRKHTWSVWGLSWKPDGNSLASVSGDGKLILWDTKTWRPWRVHTIDGGWIRTVSWSPKGTYVAIGTASAWGKGRSTVTIWNATTGQLYRRLVPHFGHLLSIAWHPTELVLASAAADGLVRIWSLATNKTIYALRGHKGWATGVQWSTDGRFLLSTSLDRSAILWELPAQRWLRFDSSTIVRARWQPQGRHIAWASKEESILLVDPFFPKKIERLRGHKKDLISLDWHPQGRFLVSRSWDQTLKIWDVAKKTVIRDIPLPAGSVHGFGEVRWDPTGKYIASNLKDHAIGIWDPLGRQLHRLSMHKHPIRALAWSSKGDWLASGGEGDRVHLWHLPQGRYHRTFVGHLDFIESLSWSGSLLASASRDKTIRIWDTRRGVLLRTLHGFQGTGHIDWVQKGRLLLAASQDHKLCLWEIEKGEKVHCMDALMHDYIFAQHWHPTLKWAMFGGNHGWMRLWRPPLTPTLSSEALIARARCAVPLRNHKGVWLPTSQGDIRACHPQDSPTKPTPHK
ncbi:MAG: WD40 repeat domain-containing protein [Myxococcales bacterium]|nr:WD40 repeat domain-containing protein [Myxococcales bacterium]